MVTYLKFFVREDDSDLSLSYLSEPELSALEECMYDLIPYEFRHADKFWFEVDTSFCYDEGCDFLEEGEEPTFGLLRCYTQNPAPKDGSVKESRIPYAFPERALEDFQGKTFIVEPRQLGLSPWGKKIEILFPYCA